MFQARFRLVDKTLHFSSVLIVFFFILILLSRLVLDGENIRVSIQTQDERRFKLRKVSHTSPRSLYLNTINKKR